MRIALELVLCAFLIHSLECVRDSVWHRALSAPQEHPQQNPGWGDVEDQFHKYVNEQAPGVGQQQPQRPFQQQPMARPYNQQPMPRPYNQQPMPRPHNQQPMPRPYNQQPMPRPQNQQPMARPYNQHPMTRPHNQQPMARPYNQQPMAPPAQRTFNQPGSSYAMARPGRAIRAHPQAAGSTVSFGMWIALQSVYNDYLTVSRDGSHVGVGGAYQGNDKMQIVSPAQREGGVQYGEHISLCSPNVNRCLRVITKGGVDCRARQLNAAKTIFLVLGKSRGQVRIGDRVWFKALHGGFLTAGTHGASVRMRQRSGLNEFRIEVQGLETGVRGRIDTSFVGAGKGAPTAPAPSNFEAQYQQQARPDF